MPKNCVVIDAFKMQEKRFRRTREDLEEGTGRAMEKGTQRYG